MNSDQTNCHARGGGGGGNGILVTDQREIA